MDTEPEMQETAYSPAAVLNIFNNALAPGPTRKIIQLRGLFAARSQQNYGGFYYGTMKDEATDAQLTVVVPALLFPKLEAGKVITVNGFINKKVVANGSRIDVQLQVTELVGQAASRFSEEDIRIAELLQAKAKNGYRDVHSFIKDKIVNDAPFKITIIIGRTAIIDSDIKHQLRESIGYYQISFVRINLSSQADIAMAAADLDAIGTDIIAISRGGGENLDVFNKHSLAARLVELKALFITAIGHKDDVTLVQKIADKAFITPSELGQFLNDIYNHTREELEHSRAQLVESITKRLTAQYQQQINALQQVNAQEVANLKKLNESNAEVLRKQALEERASLQRVQEQKTTVLAQQVAALEKDTKSKDGLINTYKSQLATAQSAKGVGWVAVIIAVIVGILIGLFLASK